MSTNDQTADGTYPVPHVGDTITTASDLDALPVGSIVRDRDGDAWLRREHEPQRPGGDWFATGGRGWSKIWPPDQYAPLTVLFRPDAPQPTTPAQRGGETLDREALADIIETAITDDGNREPRSKETRYTAHVAAGAVLTARGDAAPTEVEWGVRDAEAGWEGSDLGTWDVRGYPYDEATARFDAAKREGSRVVQRTVSAWREVS